MFPILTRDDVFRVETPRLWLRWPRVDDAARLAGWSGLPEVAGQTSTFKIGISTAEMVAKIGQMRSANASGEAISFVMVPQGVECETLGMLGVHVRPGGRLELGYHLDPAQWRRGLMTEAVQALAAQVFELAPVGQIDAAVRPQNIGSARVLEKTGFQPSGQRHHESPLYGRYLVTQYALARRKPSALLAAQRRFYPASLLDLKGAA